MRRGVGRGVTARPQPPSNTHQQSNTSAQTLKQMNKQRRGWVGQPRRGSIFHQGLVASMSTGWRPRRAAPCRRAHTGSAASAKAVASSVRLCPRVVVIAVHRGHFAMVSHLLFLTRCSGQGGAPKELKALSRVPAAAQRAGPAGSAVLPGRTSGAKFVWAALITARGSAAAQQCDMHAHAAHSCEAAAVGVP